MPSLALIAALPAELKPLLVVGSARGWQKRGPLFHGRIGSTEAVAIAAGMGAAAATHACAAILAAGSIDTLVSVGYAGSASCGLTPPQACAVREVIDAATGECFATDLPTAPAPGQLKPQRLITLDRVASPDEKRRLAAQHQAVLVDMEAAAVARFARDHNLRFLCFKAVTDGANDKLPDFNRFTGADGQLRMPAFLAYLARHPQYWGAVRTLASNSRAASRELANLVHRFFAGTQ
jgi:adenosylhomocysteine nucleosidase